MFAVGCISAATQYKRDLYRAAGSFVAQVPFAVPMWKFSSHFTPLCRT